MHEVGPMRSRRIDSDEVCCAVTGGVPECADPYSNLNDHLRHWLVPSTCMRISAPKPASTTRKTSLSFEINESISFCSLPLPNETNVGFSSKNCCWATVSACIRYVQVSALHHLPIDVGCQSTQKSWPAFLLGPLSPLEINRLLLGRELASL